MSETSFTVDPGYAERLETFRRNSQCVLRNNELLRQHLPEVIQSIIQRKPLQKSFNILSVGSCTGKTDFEILKIVKEELEKQPDNSRVKIFNRAIEHNGYSLKIYKAGFDEIPNLSGDEKLTLQLCEKTFENYKNEAEEREDKVKFDIIHFVHSLYYLEVESTLVYCMEKELAEDGCIVCILGDRDLSPSQISGSGFFDKISKVAEEQRWKYEEFSQEFPINITDIFKDDSEEGNMLLDFMMITKNARLTKSADEVKQELHAFKEASVEKDGEILLNRGNSMFVIRRK